MSKSSGLRGLLGLTLCLHLFTTPAPAESKESAPCAAKYETVIVNGSSMTPLFKDQQEIRIDQNYYTCRSVAREDIVIYEASGRKNRIVKKVIAIPGDHFEYKNQRIYINKKVQKNSVGKEYVIDSKMLALYAKSYPVLPAESYLLLGDQVGGSYDSSMTGLVGKDQIRGKYVPSSN